ncbi:MAG: glycosyltransferase [Planctomycetes bacterium]|nr:glycosyltransferase [Planctomycetota bacterium]MCB9919040.1 glycosyltransferase [Planctomycetota bacterium]
MGEQRSKLAPLLALGSAIRHEGAIELTRKFFAAVRGEGVRPALARLRIYNSRLCDDHERPVSDPHQERDVLFVSACPGGTRRYRCDHAIESLAHVGKSADMLCFPARSPEAWLSTSRAVVLQRVPFDTRVRSFVDDAHGLGIPVLFDIDDLLFDSTHAAELDAGSCERAFERQWATDHARRIGQTIEICDHVIVSTPGIDEALRACFPRAMTTIVPNVVARAMLDAADAAIREAKDDGCIRIGFFSGTPTHDEAFASVAPALDRVLTEFPDVALRLVGPVAVPSLLTKHGSRIERMALVETSRYAMALRDVAIHLAPLRNVDFDTSKSALKWLEAAIVGRPLVASACGDYARCIVPSETGFTCESQDDWYRAIARLVVSQETRDRVGASANAAVREHWTTVRVAELWRGILETTVHSSEQRGAVVR